MPIAEHIPKLDVEVTAKFGAFWSGPPATGVKDAPSPVESVKSYTRMRLQVMPGDREAGEPTAYECSTRSSVQ